MMTPWKTALILFALTGCTNGDVVDTDTDTDNKVGPQAAEQVDDWCLAATGEAAGERAFAQDFARAHVGQRLFGPTGAWRKADEHLVFLMASDTPLGPDLMPAYADFFDHVCALDARAPSPRETIVETEAGIARIVPGTGTPSLSEEIHTVVIDLRDVGPEHDVSGAIAAAVSGTVQLGVRNERKMMGFPAQETGWTHYESNAITETVTLTGNATIERDLIFWTGQRLHPEAALWVGGLRLAEKAAIVGYDVHTAVAESTWSGLEDTGLLWRSGTLTQGGTLWPDVIPADISTVTHEFYLDESIALAAIDFTANREAMADYVRESSEPPSETSQFALQAALLIAYGTLDWFYPYFEIVGRDLDAALLTELATANTLSNPTRKDMKYSIGRLMHSIHDGHGYVYDWGGTDWPEGYLAVQLQQINGEPVIRTSYHPGLFAGDTIVSIDGVSAADWYAEAITHFSATSDGYHFVMASDELKEMYGPMTLEIRDAEGVTRTETVSPQPWSVFEKVPWGGSLQPTGWLTDMGADNIFYVNLSGDVMPDETVVTDQWNAVSLADGIILDMRDYPNLDIYGLAGYFRDTNYTAPWFDFPTWSGPDQFDWEREIWSFSHASNPYTRPVVLMVSNYSVSAAECFAQMLVDESHVTVVGQQSASTNGTVTNVWLPGAFQIYFTGMRLLNLDGTNFHGVGIVPDVVVTPDPSDLALGMDPELEAALDILQP